MRKYIYMLLALGITSFIWWNSLQVASVSSGMSTRVLEAIYGILGEWSRSILTEHMVRKCAHMTEFALQAFFVALSFKETIDKAKGKVDWKVTFKTVLILSLVTASIDEFLQTFTPGRDGKVWDVGVDMVGAFFGAGFPLYLLPKIFR